ncbi:coilin [Hemiscyllium ocellatum]|uniref:coilin n=1 Tax=Hemiscyllium ocellatum TaxID=170820 RepID=UPI0029676285|nr:coilin [Hemiscyllium ocellatum]
MSAVRLRLVFEYPPPLLPASRMCWLLLQPDRCRVVADLESIIRQRFGISGTNTRLHLFVDSCLLPPNESIHLVRDNDCIRVQQEELITENGFVTSSSVDWLAVKPKKRHRQQSVEEQQPQGEPGQKKKKRKEAGLKEQRHHSVEETTVIGNVESVKKRKKTIEDDGKCNIQKKHCKKKKDKSSKDQTRRDCSRKRASSGCLGKTPSEPSAPTPLSKQGEGINVSNDFPPRREVAMQAVGSECSSSSTSESDPELATGHTITKSEGKGNSTKKLPNSRHGKRPAQTDLTPKMAGVSTESSSDSQSSDFQIPRVKKALALNHRALPPVERLSGHSENGKSRAARTSPTASSDSQDSESEQTKSRAGSEDAAAPGQTNTEGYRPTPATLHPKPAQHSDFGQGNGRGRGRGFNGFPWRGGRQQRGAFRGRGRGTGCFYYDYENSQEPKPGESNQTLTNKQPVVESSPGAPKRDYSKLPLLAAPPEVGERIAFKMLELSENYTPELSDYKEGRIVSYNASTQEVELCLDSVSTERSKEPGKFDLIYPTKNGEDVVEYAVARQPQVTESWSALVEPRLIVAPSAEPVAVELA